MSEFRIAHINEQILVCRALVVSAKNLSSSMDRFIRWVLGSFALGLTYLLANQKVSFVMLRPAILVYLCALAIGALQGYLAMIVGASTQVFQEAEKLHDERRPIDLARFFMLYIDSQPAFSRWAAALAAKRFMKGDVTSTGKTFLRIAIFQTFLGFLAFVALAISFYSALRVL